MNATATLRDWVGTKLHGPLAYCTITYKKRRAVPGPVIWLTREIMESQTKWLLMRMSRKILGHRSKAKKLDRAVFHEGDGIHKRRHTHFVLELLPSWTPEKIEDLIRSLWPQSDWGMEIFDARRCYDYLGAVSYSTKEGADAFDPFNSHFRQQ